MRGPLCRAEVIPQSGAGTVEAHMEGRSCAAENRGCLSGGQLFPYSEAQHFLIGITERIEGSGQAQIDDHRVGLVVNEVTWLCGQHLGQGAPPSL